MSRGDAAEAERAMLEVQRRQDGNGYCADCSNTERPEYVNLTHGTFICKPCSTVHRAISNRRIKDIFARELSMEDVRRMNDVGNDRANRRFLYSWDPREFPEPDGADEERLRNFIWLKYEGSWKKAAPAPAPVQPPRDVYARERELFRDNPSALPQRPSQQAPPPQQPSRSVWAERMSRSAPPREEAPRYPSERFARQPSGGGDRERFLPPVAPYNRRSDPRDVPPDPYRRDQQPRYREDYDEDYGRSSGSNADRRRDSSRSGRDSLRGGERSRERAVGRERESTRSREREFTRSRDRGSELSRDREREREVDDERDRERSRGYRKKKGKYTDSERDESEEEVERKGRSRKGKSRKQYDDDESEADDYASVKKKLAKQKKRDGKRKKKRAEDSDDDSEAESLPSTAGSARHNVAAAPAAAQPAKEFDLLMSDWMGSNEATVTAPSTAVSSNQLMAPQAVPQPQVAQVAAATAAAPAAQPMSMYGSVMPNPAAAYMTGMYYPMGVGMPMMPMGVGMPVMPQMASVVGGMANMSIAPQAQAQAPGQPQVQMPHAQPVSPHMGAVPPPPPTNQPYMGSVPPPPPPGPPPA